MKHRKTKVKTLVSSTFAFLLTLLFFTLIVFLGFGIGVFNSKSIMININESDYYNKLYAELNKKAAETVMQAGLPVWVLNGVITEERVYAGGSQYMNETLKGEKPRINTDKLQNDLKNHINQYFTEQGIEQTDEMKLAADEVVKRIVKEYQNDVKLKFINYYTGYQSHFWNLMKIIIPLNIVLIGILCYFLLRLHRYKHRGLRYINYALISSSLLEVLIAAYILINREYDKLNVMPYFYRDFLSAYLKWDIKVFLYIGGLGLILSVVLISFTGFLKNRISNS